jgi:heptosyltransferase-2
MALTGCRYFSGYKPCGKSANCNESCVHKDIPTTSILIVHLGAIGAVARSTSLLPAIKRKYPSSRIYWITDAPADQLLKNNNYIDRVLTSDFEGLMTLKAMEFDVGFVIDKSLKAQGLLKSTQVDIVYGFVCEGRTGAIVPATPSAKELWEIGLSNQKKFFENQKAETQLCIEALELGPYQRDEYHLPLSDGEIRESLRRANVYRREQSQPVIGFNTGCSSHIPYKKWTVEYHRKVIEDLLELGYKNIVLLGGKEDSERNRQISASLDIIESPTETGLRDGMISVEACDIVVTGDSLGMHLAIARKKYVIAWFGPTCSHEIDIYDRGTKLVTQAACSPCWKRHCNQQQMCYDQVSLVDIRHAIEAGTKWWNIQNPTSLFKQPFLEISY